MEPKELEGELERYHEASYGWALSCCDWRDADAGDVLQACYVKVLSGKARFKGRSAFRTWLFGVIRLTALEHYSQESGRQRRLEDWALKGRLVPNEEVGAQERVEHADRSARLLQAMGTLPERQRQVLHLVFYQGVSISEAATVLDISLGTARTHYERAKKQLRVVLDKEYCDA